MWGKACFAILFFGISVSASKKPLRCPDICGECIVPDPKHCGKYYHCKDDSAQHISCPHGLLFNTEKQFCDIPKFVNCHDRMRLTSKTREFSTNLLQVAPRKIADLCLQPEETRIFKNPDNCTSFFKCAANGQPVVIPCPDDLHYDDENKVCNWPENAGCDPSYANSNKTDGSDGDKAADKEGGDKDKGADKEGGDKDKGADKKGGDEKDSRGGDEKSTTGDSPCLADTHRSRRIPISGNCTHFILCTCDKPPEMEVLACPGNLEFDPVLRMCNHAENANCPKVISTTTPREVPDTTTPRVTPTHTPSRTPDPPSPATTTTTTTTATTTITSTTTTTPSSVSSSTDDGDISTPVRYCPSEASSICLGLDVNETRIYAHPHDCDKFCHCSQGYAFEKDCPEGTYFDIRYRTCNHAYKVNCKFDRTPATEGPTTTTAKPPEYCPDSNMCESSSSDDDVVLYAHPNNCRWYCQCANKMTAFVMRCPANLHFNPKKRVCDHPAYAGCKWSKEDWAHE